VDFLGFIVFPSHDFIGLTLGVGDASVPNSKHETIWRWEAGTSESVYFVHTSYYVHIACIYCSGALHTLYELHMSMHISSILWCICNVCNSIQGHVVPLQDIYYILVSWSILHGRMPWQLMGRRMNIICNNISKHIRVMQSSCTLIALLFTFHCVYHYDMTRDSHILNVLLTTCPLFWLYQMVLVHVPIFHMLFYSGAPSRSYCRELLPGVQQLPYDQIFVRVFPRKVRVYCWFAGNSCYVYCHLYVFLCIYIYDVLVVDGQAYFHFIHAQILWRSWMSFYVYLECDEFLVLYVIICAWLDGGPLLTCIGC